MIRAIQIASILLLGLSCQKVEELPLDFDLGNPDLEFLGVDNEGYSVYNIAVAVRNLDEVLLKQIVMDFENGDQVTYSDIEFKDGGVLLGLWMFYGDRDSYRNKLTFIGSNSAGEALETEVEFLMERPIGSPSSTH